jgi:DNA-binding NarL/FixJ family response regulator
MQNREAGAPSGPIRVVLADDHDLVRSGIRSLLSRIDGVEVVGEARDGESLLAVLGSVQPDIVMTDLSMPGMDGIEAIGQITKRHPDVRVIVLSMHDQLDFVRRAIANGACGYLMKNSPPATLEQALRCVMAEGSFFEGKVAQQLVRSPRASADDELTFRQVQILTLLAEGKSSKEIAYELGLSSKTVDVHRARIMTRLQLNDLASLTRYAVRKGLVKL